MSSSDMCAVCSNEGPLQCSACRAVRFCSKRCLRLLWPTHKVLCGRDVDKFYLPPLTPEELETLDQVKATPALVPGLHGRSLVDFIKGGYFEPLADFLWTTFWNRLVAPASDDPYEENKRLENVALAYDALAHAADRSRSAGNSPSRPWQLFAKSCMAFHPEYCTAVAKLSGVSAGQASFDEATQRGSFTVLNPLIRQQLVHATVSCQPHIHPDLITEDESLELVQAGRRRAIQWLRESDLPEVVKQRLLAQAQVGFFRGEYAQSVIALDKLNISS